MKFFAIFITNNSIQQHGSAAMTDGWSALKKLAYSLKPEYMPMGSWIGQIILSTPLSGLSGLVSYYNATQGGR